MTSRNLPTIPPNSIQVGKSQRNKGAAGEREVFKILNDELGLGLKRDLSQTQDGGCDFTVANFACEIKRQETLSLGSWWDQTARNAGKLDLIPALLYRQSRQPWRVMLPFAYISDIFWGWDTDIPLAPDWAADFDRTATILLQPMFTDLIRENMSSMALAAMREKASHTTQ